MEKIKPAMIFISVSETGNDINLKFTLPFDRKP